MRRRDFRENKSPLVMIIPMIDIMLFLLVFFMLSTIYMVQTNNFNVDLPKSEEVQQKIQPKIVSISVTQNGEIFFENSKILNKNLPQIVNHELSKDSEIIFVIYGDKFAKYEKIVDVLDLLKKSGATHISLATELKK